MESTDGIYRAADLCLKVRELGYFCKITDVAKIIHDLDVSTIFDHYFDITTFVLWDKKSSISGISAQELISNYGMTDENDAFAVFSENMLVAFHVTAPNGSGQLMTKDEALSFGESTKNMYVINRTNQEILNVVCDKLMEEEIKRGKEFTPPQ